MSDIEGFDAWDLPPVDVEGVIAGYKVAYPRHRPLGHAEWQDDPRTAQLREHVFGIVNDYEDQWPLGPRQVGPSWISRRGARDGISSRSIWPP